MFDGIETRRILSMTPQEKRLLNNVKKAFYASDQAVVEGKAADRCLEELFKAIDAAKNLRRLLRGEQQSKVNQKKQFLEFIHLEVPSPENGGMNMPLRDTRTGKDLQYSFAELVYDVRCMIVHENENLNAAEKPNYHIQLDWGNSLNGYVFGQVTDGTLVCSGAFIWNRLREILAKFITGLESQISFHESGTFNITVIPPLGSIKPK
jgi:hypothetical protein